MRIEGRTRLQVGHAPGMALLAFCMLAGASSPLRAQDSRFGGQMALASQLVDQGLAITEARGVFQGVIAWDSPGGWSVGLSAASETRTLDQPVLLLGRVSRSWNLSNDWRAQAGLLYYDYRHSRIPDRADANMYLAYRDVLTLGVSLAHVEGGRSRRWRGAADGVVSWPLTRHLTLAAGAGVAQATVFHRYYPSYAYPAYGREQVLWYGYGNVGLAWSAGAWRLQLDRTASSLGARRAYGTRAAADWVATLSRSF